MSIAQKVLQEMSHENPQKKVIGEKSLCAEKTGWDRMKVIYPKCATSPCPSIDNNPKAITKAYNDCLNGIESKTTTKLLTKAKQFFDTKTLTITILVAAIILGVIFRKKIFK